MNSKENVMDRILQEIHQKITENHLKQSEVLELCREAGYTLTQPELSRVLSGNTSLGLYPAVALCDVLDIDMTEVLHPGRRLLELSHCGFESRAASQEIRNYLGEYKTLFCSTDVQEKKVLHGKLSLWENPSGRCSAAFSLDTGDTGTEGKPVLKKYEGTFFVSRKMGIAYCILLNNVWGEFCLIEFRHRTFFLKRVESRLGLALTVSAGERKVPAAHKFFIYREEYDLSTEEPFVNVLKMSSERIAIEKDAVDNTEWSQREEEVLSRLFEVLRPTPCYMIDEALLKSADRKLSNYECNQILARLRKLSDQWQATYIDEAEDTLLYEMIQGIKYDDPNHRD